MFTDFYEAYHWLNEHPIFKEPKFRVSCFQDGLYVDIVKVNPATETIESDASLNTATRVWLEHGPYEITTEEEHSIDWEGCSHDIDLDCGAPTFEEAIMELANLVEKYYGTYDPDTEAERDWNEYLKHEDFKDVVLRILE